jgi:hypothetical protein
VAANETSGTLQIFGGKRWDPVILRDPVVEFYASSNLKNIKKKKQQKT